MTLRQLCFVGMLSFCCLMNVSARQLYLSTTGKSLSGKTIDDPFGDPIKAFAFLQAGDTLWVRGGTYNLSQTIKVSQTGTKEQRICVFAYQDERPVFDFSGQPRSNATEASVYRGIMHNIGANYWHYKGLDICHSADNGMKLEGSYCVVELCRFYGNGDTGLQQGFGKGSNGENTRNPNYYFGRYNIVVNCDAYDNYDQWTDGGNADGFAIKLFPGPGNEFHGCRAWHNSDDAWDMYYTVFPVLIENCWALKNGFNSGNGNGFKCGGCKQGGYSVGSHILINDIAMWQVMKGFDQNHHREGCTLINCLAAYNGSNYAFSDKSPLLYGNWVLRNDVGFKPTSKHNNLFDNMPDISNCSWIDINKVDPLSDMTGTNKMSPSKWPDYASEYEDLTYETAISARQADGELPLKFARLKATSLFVDKGVAIKDFKTNDAHKSQYEYSTTAPQNYSVTLNIPYQGTAPDYGPFELNGNDNQYKLVLPVNDGTVDDAQPIDNTDDGKNYQEKFIVNNYLFQEKDSVMPDSISKYISGTTADGMHPYYYGKGGSLTNKVLGQKYGASTSYGAYRMPKGTYIEFTLPSLAEFKSNIYCTGSRTLTISWNYKDSALVNTSTKAMSTGTVAVDIASMAKQSKQPVVVKISNPTGGDMYLTDLTIATYEEVDENGNVVTAIKNVSDESSKQYDMYMMDNAIIVYGDVASLRLYSIGGQSVGSSFLSQYICTAQLGKGAYILVINGKNGTHTTRKFVKR